MQAALVAVFFLNIYRSLIFLAVIKITHIQRTLRFVEICCAFITHKSTQTFQFFSTLSKETELRTMKFYVVQRVKKTCFSKYFVHLRLNFIKIVYGKKIAC